MGLTSMPDGGATNHGNAHSTENIVSEQSLTPLDDQSPFRGEFLLGVVTLGLIGGSVALAARERGVRVVAWDRNPVTRAAALAKGVEVVESLDDLGRAAPDLIMVSSPLVAMPEIMAALAQSVPVRTTITDAGSVKERVHSAVDAAGLSAQYIGAHPMAGTEKSGFVHAFPELFQDATWGLTLRQDSEFERFALVLNFITEVMAGSVLVTDDSTHDDSVALVSHLPHVLSHTLTSVVAASDKMPLALRLAAGSFRDGTRVARGSVERNAAMISENMRAVKSAVDAAVETLAALQSALERDDDAAVSTFFAAGSAVVDYAPNSAAHALVISPEAMWQSELLEQGMRGGVVSASTWDRAANTLQVTYR